MGGQTVCVHVCTTGNEAISFASVGAHVLSTACAFILYTPDEIPAGLKIKSHFKK